jgi:hypothetical protein
MDAEAATTRSGYGLVAVAGVDAFLRGHSMTGTFTGTPECDHQQVTKGDLCQVWSTKPGATGSFGYAQMVQRGNDDTHRDKMVLEWGGAGVAAFSELLLLVVAL